MRLLVISRVKDLEGDCWWIMWPNRGKNLGGNVDEIVCGIKIWKEIVDEIEENDSVWKIAWEREIGACCNLFTLRRNKLEQLKLNVQFNM